MASFGSFFAFIIIPKWYKSSPLRALLGFSFKAVLNAVSALFQSSIYHCELNFFFLLLFDEEAQFHTKVDHLSMK